MSHDKSMEHVCSSLCAIAEAFECEVSGGVDKLNTIEAGQVADIIKDLAEAKKLLCEGWYYHEVAEAMEASEVDDRYGYTPRKIGHESERSYIKRWMDDPEGFEAQMRSDPYMRSEDRRKMRDDRYGKTYHEYLDSRKHYTETKSQADKEEMEMHANEHLMDMMTSVKEIFRSADPDMRKRFKSDLTKFVGELPV